MMKKDKAGRCCCMKWFPKAFNNGETEFIENGYPRYKRRDSLHRGFVTYRTVNGKVYTIDNRWVVPYNRVLSEMFNCHMNVEVVSTVGAVKYICLYLTKVARYISSQEALWRLFEFDILKKYPPVEKLAIHLPDQQTVVFDPNNLDHVLLDGPPVTSLTAYFQLNTEDLEARAFTYTEICRYYRFVRKNWVKRQRNTCSGKPGGPLSDTIGRMPVINFTPKQAELYYLRLLLHHIPGPKSFNDLKIVNNVPLGTYREACLALGLITDDTECDQAIDEAASVRFGPNLRELFSTLLVYGELSDPAKLWDSHKDQLVEDIAHRNGRTGSPNDSDFNDALIDIQRHLNVFELSLSADFLIHCIGGITTMVPEIQAFDEQFLADLSEANLSKMTHDQMRIYNQVMESIDSGNGTCFVLNAAGCTGKTFIVTTLLSTIRARGQIAIATAVSGIAATLLHSGRTLHSKLSVPVDFDEFSMCSISSQSNTAKELRTCKLLVVDEVTMAYRHIFEAVDRTLRDITGFKNRLFGGITVLLSGDWRQILPVVKHGGQADVINACLKKSYIWAKIVKLNLTKNIRLLDTDQENEKFAKYLLNVRDGKVPPLDNETPDMIPIPSRLQLDDNTLTGLCDFVYDGMSQNLHSPEWICSRGILSPTNEATEEVNSTMTARFPGNNRDFSSADSLCDDSVSYQYPIEYLNSITPSGMPTHRLTLKVGLPVMLLRNLDPANHHCNGTRYVITQIHDHLLEVAIAAGPKVGLKKFIPRIALISTDKSLPFRIKRVQFPLKVCFGMTINKSQGQSFSKVGIYLKRDVFAHGQLYVALSRVRDSQAPKILPCESNPHSMKNVVYKDIVSI